MGFLSWLRGRTEPDLTKTLMEAEIARQQRAAEVELKRLDIERFRLEKEFENIEAIAEQKRLDREAAQALKERKREWAAQARAKIKPKGADASTGGPSGAPTGFRTDCRVCTGERLSEHTAAEIIFHSNGHRLIAVQ